MSTFTPPTSRRRISLLVLSPHHEVDYSGPALLLERVIDCLDDEAYTVVVGPGERRLSLPCGVAYVELRGTSKHSAAGRLLWAVKAAVWAGLRGRRFDVAHFHGTFIHELFPALVLRRLRAPYVLFPLTEGGDLRPDSRSSNVPGIRTLRKSLVQGAALAFSLSPSISEELKYWGLRPDRIMSIGNPATPQFFERPKEPDGRLTSRTIGFIGKLAPRKQPHLIIEALSLPHQRGFSDANALFVGPFGDDSYRQRLEALVVKQGLTDHVTFAGHTDNVAPFLKERMSFFALPSLTEGLPGAMTEALATGLPCAVSRAGSMQETIEASGGGSVVETSAAAIADFAETVWRDPALWKRYSEAGRAHALERFSPESVALRYISGLGSVVEGRS